MVPTTIKLKIHHVYDFSCGNGGHTSDGYLYTWYYYERYHFYCSINALALPIAELYRVAETLMRTFKDGESEERRMPYSSDEHHESYIDNSHDVLKDLNLGNYCYVITKEDDGMVNLFHALLQTTIRYEGVCKELLKRRLNLGFYGSQQLSQDSLQDLIINGLLNQGRNLIKISNLSELLNHGSMDEKIKLAIFMQERDFPFLNNEQRNMLWAGKPLKGLASFVDGPSLNQKDEDNWFEAVISMTFGIKECHSYSRTAPVINNISNLDIQTNIRKIEQRPEGTCYVSIPSFKVKRFKQ